MQAFVAGVEYADRELCSSEADALRRREAELRTRVVAIEQQLGRFEPLASVDASAEDVAPPRRAVDVQHNIDRFLPVTTKRLRFTISATNRLEPCIDELEVYDTENRNVALATLGTSVTSSGDRVSANRHELRLINDGVVGNSSSWMSSEVGKGFVIFEFASEQLIERVVWSRDRTGNFSDRLATDYRIEVEVASEQWQLVASSLDRRVIDAPEKSNAKTLPYQTSLNDAEDATSKRIVA